MCQLLGMNCNTPTDIQFSFEGFYRRGGLTDHHADGWGIAFFENHAVRMFLDDAPSAHSQVAEFIRRYPIRAKNVIAHIRKATQGVVNLANVHPFARELWGQYWIFAHNGNLQDIHRRRSTFFQPVGETDSELAFCLLLDFLRQKHETKPEKSVLYQSLAEIVSDLRQYGVFNFMLSNGEFLAAHCSTRLHYLIRQAPFAQANLIDNDVSIDFASVTTPQDRVAVITTQPLTQNETWQAMRAGEFLIFEDGLPQSILVQGEHAPSPNHF